MDHVTDAVAGADAVERRPSSGRWSRVGPTLTILLVAPVFGESLSGSTPPLDLLLPWNLVLFMALYGSGALLCREVAHRWRLGFSGVCLLGGAYGVFEEALVDRFWFYPRFWSDAGVGSYSEVWHTNVLLAAHLTVFHAAVSVGASVLVVERLFPAARDRAWVGRPGLVIALFVLAATPIVYGETSYRPVGPQLMAGAIVVAMVGSARLTRRHATPGAPVAGGPGRRGLGWIAFVGVAAHFVLVYALPSTGLWWPAGVVLSLLPVTLAVLALRRWARTGPYDADGWRAVTGLVGFFALLDLFVGSLGRYDLALSGPAIWVWIVWLGRRSRRARRPGP